MATGRVRLLTISWTTIFSPIRKVGTHVSAALMRIEPSHDFGLRYLQVCRLCRAARFLQTHLFCYTATRNNQVAAAGKFQSHHLVSSCNSTAALADRSPSWRSRLLQRAAIRSLKNPMFLTQLTLVASSPLLAVLLHSSRYWYAMICNFFKYHVQHHSSPSSSFSSSSSHSL